ncbi:MAG TPA: hypothetical protein VJU86_13205 [Pyrinomonadaceae bacterium]|nr:hypothetical protein [Pyrinomonadaceae bacterium]
MANILSKLTKPWYPSTSVGFEKGLASVVQLDRGKNGSATVRRAATVALPDSLITPSFDESNVSDMRELANALTELGTSAGLMREKRWSVALPEAASRSLILTLETKPASNAELEEVLAWKMERGFSSPLDELSIARQRLPADAQGKDRYMVVATRSSVLKEFETVLSTMGWRAGLILPRHVGEGQWLTMNGATGDSLLLSSSREGFLAVVFRGKQPLMIRAVNCDKEECQDELYRLLLYYRDRRSGETQSQVLARVLVIGETFDKELAVGIVNETLGTDLRPLAAPDVGLQLATRQLSFDAIAAPAGLATLSWQ